jgi:hypothetical protein
MLRGGVRQSQVFVNAANLTSNELQLTSTRDPEKFLVGRHGGRPSRKTNISEIGPLLF